MKKLILLVLLSATHLLFAKAATVISTKDTVTLTHNGSQRTISRGAAVDVGDSIVTAAGAIARIRYGNGTLVSIAPNSNYKILAFAPDAEVQIKAELSKGAIVSKTRGNVKESLKTPVIAMAILGTKYAAFVRNSKQTYAQVMEGSVQVGDRVLGPGDSVMATPDGVVDAPFPNPGFVASESQILDAESAATGADSATEGGDTTEGSSGAEAESAETESAGMSSLVEVVEQGYSLNDSMNSNLEADQTINETYP